MADSRLGAEERFDPTLIRTFVRESNRIEGITRAPRVAEVEAHLIFLSLTSPSVEDLSHFVLTVAGKLIRDQAGLDVRVGPHIAPPGGPGVVAALEDILYEAQGGFRPFAVHRRYETLHPFMHGNGRSGRVLWLWQMLNQDHGDRHALARGFLHTFYYQALRAG